MFFLIGLLCVGLFSFENNENVALGIFSSFLQTVLLPSVSHSRVNHNRPLWLKTYTLFSHCDWVCISPIDAEHVSVSKKVIMLSNVIYFSNLLSFSTSWQKYWAFFFLIGKLFGVMTVTNYFVWFDLRWWSSVKIWCIVVEQNYQ